jgi:hypothetical protein
MLGGSDNFGSLGGDGADEIHRVQTKPLGREGAKYQLRCQHCGQPVHVEVSWAEMAYVALGQQPPGWIYEQTRGAMRPNIGCGLCHVVIMLLFTPDECGRNLAAGEAAGYIAPGYVRQAQQRLGQAGAGYRR